MIPRLIRKLHCGEVCVLGTSLYPRRGVTGDNIGLEVLLFF